MTSLTEPTHAHNHADTWFECAEACATACLDMGDQDSRHHDMTLCIKLCRDCADICTLCGRLEARGSQFMQPYRQLCADVCAACATECEKHADHVAHCKACAAACRRCEAECRQMANQM